MTSTRRSLLHIHQRLPTAGYPEEGVWRQWSFSLPPSFPSLFPSRFPFSLLPFPFPQIQPHGVWRSAVCSTNGPGKSQPPNDNSVHFVLKFVHFLVLAICVKLYPNKLLRRRELDNSEIIASDMYYTWARCRCMMLDVWGRMKNFLRTFMRATTNFKLEIWLPKYFSTRPALRSPKHRNRPPLHNSFMYLRTRFTGPRMHATPHFLLQIYFGYATANSV